MMERRFVYHTIVIGAGIAGMTAANKLADQGNKVLVLEANSYIGGRMKTVPVKLSNNSVFNFEEGANWIHGASKKNPITQLAHEVQGVKLMQTDDQSVVVYDQNGKQVDKQVDKQYQQYENLLQKIQNQQNMSMYQAIKKLNSSKIHNKIFMYNMANDTEFQTSGTLQTLSAEYGQDDSSFQGQDKIVLSGYQRFVEHLSDHKNIEVLLNHKVSKISYNGTKNTVQCSNSEHVFESENVVIAVPIGVLKKNYIKFSPELPQWKQTAIKSLCMGNVCKILIKFDDKKFKTQDKEQYIGVVDNDVNKRGAATYFLNLNKLAKIPSLMTFGLGPNSDELEFMSEGQLKQLITKRLKVFIDDDISSDDFQIMKSTWRGNPNFGGAYTYSGVQTKPAHWKNMAKPIFENNWYFCGQHTYSKYRGTVHGAYLSGKSVADVITDEITQKNWRYVGKSQQD